MSEGIDKAKKAHEEPDAILTVKDVERTFSQITTEIRKVVIGKIDIIEFLFIAILTGKHVYLEGVPGIAKTWITNRFSDSMGCEFSRIQFTPDMLPSDIVGTNIFNTKTGTFRLRKGPIFANIVLADEVNRAPPKTQSAMLEAMGERQVSIEGETHRLQRPFTVIATANPVEQEGTYPLPEAQLDRFLVKLNLIYPTPEEELDVIRLKNNPTDAKVDVVTSPQTLVQFQQVVRNVYVHDDILKFIRDVVVQTRQEPRLTLGCSPRASISLLDAGKARAAIHGREFVIPDDILFMTKHVLHHRMILKPETELEGITTERVAEDIKLSLTIPVDEEAEAEYLEEEEYEDEEYDDEEYEE